jgi:hemophore-related protein
MTSTVTRVRRTVFGVLAAGAACATLAIPAAGADPEDTPTDPAPAADTPAVADDCNAATLATTISSVTTQLSTYFAAHPDANQALIDATRQPAFVAVGQFDDYIAAHPDQAESLRTIQAPLVAFKDRCGMQVSPTDALTVLADV